MIEERGRAEVSFDFDYLTKDIIEEEGRILGTLQFSILVKAKIKSKLLFKIELVMDGIFAGNSKELLRDNFIEMLEVNGLINMLHISRAYLLSVTAQSGVYPPIKIPMINILKLREKKAQEK